MGMSRKDEKYQRVSGIGQDKRGMAQNSRVCRGAGAIAQIGSRRSMVAGRRAATDDGMQHSGEEQQTARRSTAGAGQSWEAMTRKIDMHRRGPK